MLPEQEYMKLAKMVAKISLKLDAGLQRIPAARAVKKAAALCARADHLADVLRIPKKERWTNEFV